MRSFIRHPSDIPIEFTAEDQHASVSIPMKDVSVGGLSFSSSENMTMGTLLHIRIDVVQPTFEADGVVVWSRQEGEQFIIGMEFLHKEDIFLARMVEQICHIEHYRKEVDEKEGRQLTSQQAAKEWIAKFAKVFPNPTSCEND